MKKRVFAALGSLLTMNVVCLGMLTFAWFTANQKVENGMNDIVAVSDDPFDIDFELYEYDEDNLTGRVASDKVITEDDGTEHNTSRFALPQFDTFIPERNVFNNKIMRIEIQSKIPADSSSSFSLSIPCSGSFLDSGNNITKNMSNIIGFKYFLRHQLPSDDQFDESAAGAIYDGAYDVFSGITSYTNYVTAIEETPASDDKNMTITFSGLDIDEENEDGITVLYLEYYYDENLIDHYFNHSLDEKPTADNLSSNAISFSCDIVKFQFDAEDTL